MTFKFSKVNNLVSILGMCLSFLAIILETFTLFTFSNNQVAFFTFLFIASFVGLVISSMNNERVFN